MIFHILSLDDARARAAGAPGDFTHAIQILDPDERQAFPPLARIALRLRFEDATREDEAMAPGENEIARVIRFGRGLPASARLAVHCGAGRSRSTAAAMIVLVAQGADAEVAAQHIDAACPDAAPNEVMLRIAGRLLDCGEALVIATQPMRDRWSLDRF